MKNKEKYSSIYIQIMIINIGYKRLRETANKEHAILAFQHS